MNNYFNLACEILGMDPPMCKECGEYEVWSEDLCLECYDRKIQESRQEVKS